jgi:hypothetical protein
MNNNNNNDDDNDLQQQGLSQVPSGSASVVGGAGASSEVNPPQRGFTFIVSPVITFRS